MAKRKIIVANWKMHPATIERALNLFDGIKKAVEQTKHVDTIICPPHTFLDTLAYNYKRKKIAFSAQDVFWEVLGAYTGQVSASMLKSVGASYVLIGHSERRRFGESNEDVRKKVDAALTGGLRVILCVGEIERDRSAEYLEFLRKEILSALMGVERAKLSRVIVAYEPIWAIGKSAEFAMTPQQLHETVIYIRKILSERYEKKDAFKVPILYGGAVEAENVASLLREGEVQGLLVGHASLEPKVFTEILIQAESV